MVSSAVVGAAPQERPVLRLDDDPASATYGCFEAVGLDPAILERLRSEDRSYREWVDLFPIYTVDAAPGAASGRPPVLGAYSVESDRVLFTPRFPTAPGLTYVALWQDPYTEASLALPAPKGEPTTLVSAVYPSAAEVPENLLKLYIQFSAPMSRGEAHRHLHLSYPEGSPIRAPFVAPEIELWNPESDRLTVFFDPGRLKRGLQPHREQGTPLVAGESFRLVVDSAWLDARGRPLAAPYERTFRVTEADRSSPEHADWTLLPPAGPKGALELRFPEPLDRALLLRWIRVAGPAGSPIPGRIEVDEHETVWRFLPLRPWKAGCHEVRVNAALEDLAGNSLARLFDMEMAPGAPPGVDAVPDTIRLPFSVSACIP